jgi:transposase-like protein
MTRALRGTANQNQTKNMSAETRQEIIRQCVEEQISPVELARRYSLSADTIRGWVKKSGLTLPKTYRKTSNVAVIKTAIDLPPTAQQQHHHLMSTSSPLGQSGQGG